MTALAPCTPSTPSRSRHAPARLGDDRPTGRRCPTATGPARRDVDRALGDEQVRPEIAVRAGAPGPAQQGFEGGGAVAPALVADEGGVGQAGVLDRRDPRHGQLPRLAAQHGDPAAGALGRPPAASEGGRGHDADDRLVVVEQGDQGGPHRHAADEALGAVDRVEHPAPVAAAGRAELLAEHRVVGPLDLEQVAQGLLDGPVGVADGGEVRFGLDDQVLGAEAGQRDAVGELGQRAARRRSSA